MLRVVMFWSSRSALFNFGLRVFLPDVAVITNVAGDHADYFLNDTQAYAAAKAQLLNDMKPGNVAVLRSDDPIVSQFETPTGVQRVEFSPAEVRVGWGISGESISRDGVALMSTSELNVSGVHNVCNVQAALAAGSRSVCPWLV